MLKYQFMEMRNSEIEAPGALCCCILATDTLALPLPILSRTNSQECTYYIAFPVNTVRTRYIVCVYKNTRQLALHSDGFPPLFIANLFLWACVFPVSPPNYVYPECSFRFTFSDGQRTGHTSLLGRISRQT